MASLPHRLQRDETPAPERVEEATRTFTEPGDRATRRPPQAGVAAAVPAAPGGLDELALPEAPPRARVRELTWRALLAGAGIGALLAAGNVYTSLKSTFIDGGALTATLISFAGFGLFRRISRTPFSPLENNIAQTVSASAAVMAYAHGLMGPIPALELMGHPVAMWAVWLWGLGLAAVGILLAAVLRAKLIEQDRLPFPSGTATAELIQAIHADRHLAARRSRVMMGVAVAAAVVTALRDGPHPSIPAVIYLPLTVWGLSAASLTTGLAASPLMAATGVLVGLKTAFTLLGGGLVGWLILAPLALRAGWVKTLGYADLVAWLVWPAIGLMLSGTLTSAILGAPRLLGTLLRVGQDLRRVALSDRALSAGDRLASALGGGPRRAGRLAVIGAVALLPVGLGIVGVVGFGYSPWFFALSILATALMGVISARAAGETDIAPVGQMGTSLQIATSAGGPTTSILSGSVVAGAATQTAQSLWSFRTGHLLGASPRAQVAAQLVGAAVGAVVAVPTYVIVTHAYGLGTEQMPAVSAFSWKATSLAFGGGLSGAMGDGRGVALGTALLAGCALTALARRPGLSRIVPSPTALGISLLTPVSLSAAAALGASASAVIRRLTRAQRPPLAAALPTSLGAPNAAAAGRADDDGIAGLVDSAAAGALAGEAITGVFMAALAAGGFLR